MSRQRFLIWVRSLLIVFALVLFLLGSIHALVAQDVTEEPTAELFPTLVTTDPAPEPTLPAPTEEPPPPVEEPPEETPVTEPQELLGLLFSLFKDATFIAWAAPGVVIVVGLLKALGGSIGFNISGSAAVLLTLVIQVLIWLGYAIANYFGAGEAFQKGYLIAVDIGRSLLPLAGSIFVGQVIYRASANRSVPILGYRAPDSGFSRP